VVVVSGTVAVAGLPPAASVASTAAAAAGWKVLLGGLLWLGWLSLLWLLLQLLRVFFVWDGVWGGAGHEDPLDMRNKGKPERSWPVRGVGGRQAPQVCQHGEC
jgi:hypothetical protein